MKEYFEFSRHGTSYRQETLAGITTFLTMAYIVIVNPAILEAAGIPRGPSMVATIVSTAFIAFTVVKVLGYPWQAALGAVFVAGVLFTLLTVFKVRSWLAESLPLSLKFSFAAGIG